METLERREIEARQDWWVFKSKGGTVNSLSNKEKEEIYTLFSLTCVKAEWKDPLLWSMRKTMQPNGRETYFIDDKLRENILENEYLMGIGTDKICIKCFSYLSNFSKEYWIDGKQTEKEKVLNEMVWLNREKFSKQQLENFAAMTYTRKLREKFLEKILFDAAVRKAMADIEKFIQIKSVTTSSDYSTQSCLVYELEMNGVIRTVQVATEKGVSGGPKIKMYVVKDDGTSRYSLMGENIERELPGLWNTFCYPQVEFGLLGNYGNRAMVGYLLDHCLHKDESIRLKMTFDAEFKGRLLKMLKMVKK